LSFLVASGIARPADPLVPDDRRQLSIPHSYCDGQVSVYQPFPSASLDSLVQAKALQVQEAADYPHLLARIESARKDLAGEYARDPSPAALSRSREFLLTAMLDEVLPLWYGTPWDFNGSTAKPQHGEIACGVFVSTILKDLGFEVERIALARQPSEYIIKSLVGESRITRFSNHVPIHEFVRKVQGLGPGLYVVGLDCHTGFLVSHGSEVSFVHSSYMAPFAVVREKAEDSSPLTNSGYRVVGKLLDDAMVEAWLRGQPFPTRHYRRP